MSMKLKFWGTRGSIPTPGKKTVKFGGNTSCVSVEDDEELIIFDGGSGLRELGIDLMKNKQFKDGFTPLTMHIFFSHLHWDHIQGIPFFKPMFIKRNQINLYGEKKVRTCLENTLKGQQQYPNFPISIEEICINGATMNFTDMYPGQGVEINPYLHIFCTKLSHPDGVFCYKITSYDNPNSIANKNTKSIVYATDTEHRNVLDPRLLKIALNADVLIYDAQYTPEEYSGQVGGIPKFDWGHSTYEFGVDTALEAGVKRLVLFHHDPEHDDEAVGQILTRARERVEKSKKSKDLDVVAAYEGMTLDI
jgi:phosphoribosyl 1,2-cyclic phosphodiesterase